MMQSKRLRGIAALCGLGVLSIANALPNVTVLPLPATCESWPDFHEQTGQSGPWIVQADSTGNPDVDEHGSVASFSRGANSIRWGYMNIAVNNELAKNPLMCGTDNTLKGLVPWGVDGYDWRSLVAATSIPYSAMFGYDFPGTNSPIEPYKHYIDGVEQPGVYLGAQNITTWAFQYTSSEEFDDYYSVRFLGANSADPSTGEPLFEGEFTGFIKVQSP